MNEVKTPKKPLIFYYVMVFLLLMMLNFMAIPWMAERQVREVDYGTFMTMTEDKNLQVLDMRTVHCVPFSDIFCRHQNIIFEIIFYFTGTGNSLWAAKEIGKELNQPVENIIKQKAIFSAKTI